MTASVEFEDAPKLTLLVCACVRGLARVRSVEGLDAKGNKKKMKKKEAKLAAAAYAALTDEDWCTTQVHQCAMLLGEL